MKVEVHLLSQSNPIVCDEVVNAYMKDGMYCMLDGSGIVVKYPMVNIFRVKEFPESSILTIPNGGEGEIDIDINNLNLFKSDIILPPNYTVYTVAPLEFDSLVVLSDNELDGANIMISKNSIIIKDGN